MALAHSGGPGGRGHDLVDHLRDVASQARRFAERARPEDPDFAAMAEWSGWLHDLGKFRDEFQSYLAGQRPGGVETQHAVFGAARAAVVGLPCALALAILGHHAGLPKLAGVQSKIRDPTLDPLRVAQDLVVRLQSELGGDPAWPPAVSEFLGGRKFLEATYGQEMLIRVLFSCLVDADYLDTERYYAGGRERATTPLDARSLFETLDRHVRGLEDKSPLTPINRARRELYDACVAAAESASGIFRLTAPTGSGKTLAMLAFALRHAELWGLDRVIVVLPFLAIIEQNARVYREALGADDAPGILVEHHSAVHSKGDESEPGETESPDQVRSKQAVENWDAPVIVTTAVQFLESLFARRSGACRKLHNIARSVVVFDEVQTLPFPLLDPILSAVRDLHDTFGVTFLLGSATQPRLERSSYLPSGLRSGEVEGREIVADRVGFFSVFRRAVLSLPCLTEPPWSWDDLARRLEHETRALIIVNLRKHAQDLFDRLKTARVPGLFHLSSTMCAAHREEKLGRKKQPEPGTIYHALERGDPCVVVSTQVVEAGVDLDFPVVYRAEAPLDAIIQAAGRCDREGNRTREAGRPAGRVVVFRPAAEPATPPGYYQFATKEAVRLLEEHAADPQVLLDDPDHFARYHQGLIASGEGHDLGSKIQAARRKLDYPEVATLFRIIDDAGQGVVVPRGDAQKIIEAIRQRQHVTLDDRRALQRYTVNLLPTWLSRLQSELQPLIDREGAPLLYVGAYDPDLGIRLGELPAEAFCVSK